MDKLKEVKLFILDMDGTLYLGDDVFPGAIDFVNLLDNTGRRYIYLTNNSSRAGKDYVSRLRRFGFPCRDEDVFTSGMATAIYLNEHYHGKAIYPVGTSAFCNELESYGVKLGESEPAAVVVGFDRELTYEKLEKAVRFMRRGADFIASNPDRVCPMPGNEVLPDCGSICALLTAATGSEPFYIGKPNRSMVDIISKHTGVQNRYIAAVGDRLYTDMAVAANSGCVSVLVLSGETKREMLKASPLRPDFVFENVSALAAALES